MSKKSCLREKVAMAQLRGRGRMLVRAVLIIMSTLITTAVVLPTTAMGAEANAPNFTIAVEPTTTTSPSGADVFYSIKYECSSLAPTCSGATIVADLPRQLTPATPLFPGETTTAVPGSGRGNGNASTASVTATDTAVTFTMKELKGGDTGELTVTWRLPAVTFRPGVQVSETVTATDTETQQTVTSAPILIGTASQYGVRIGMENPKLAAQATVNTDITYRVFPCIPNAGNPGTTGVTGQTMTLTLPAGIKLVSAEGNPTQNADGTVLTWSVPDGTLNTCATPDVSYLVTVRYPKETFEPPAHDPPTSKKVTVTLTGSATGWDGKSFTAENTSTAVQHTFNGLWVQYPTTDEQIQEGIYNTPNGATDLQVSYLDTESHYMWAGAYGWFDTENGVVPPINYSEVNWNTSVMRFPHLTSTGAVAPRGIAEEDPIETHASKTWITVDEATKAGWDETDIPADATTNPAFRPSHVNIRSDARAYTRHISVITWNGSIHQVHNVVLPGGAGDGQALTVRFYGDGNGNLGLSEDEIVTDLRVAGVGVPERLSQWFYVSGTSTQAFADSGLKRMTSNLVAYRGSIKWPATGPTEGLILSYGIRATVAREATQTFIDPVPDPQITLRSTAPEGAFAFGSTVGWQAVLRNGVAGSPLTPLAAVNIPEGLTLVPESVKWSNLGTVDGIQPTLSYKGVNTRAGQKYMVYAWTRPDGTVMDPPSWKNSADYPYYQAGEYRLSLSTRRSRRPSWKGNTAG